MMKRTNDNIIQVKQFSDKHKPGGEERGQPGTDKYVIEAKCIEVVREIKTGQSLDLGPNKSLMMNSK